MPQIQFLSFSTFILEGRGGEDREGGREGEGRGGEGRGREGEERGREGEERGREGEEREGEREREREILSTNANNHVRLYCT